MSYWVNPSLLHWIPRTPGCSHSACVWLAGDCWPVAVTVSHEDRLKEQLEAVSNWIRWCKSRNQPKASSKSASKKKGTGARSLLATGHSSSSLSSSSSSLSSSSLLGANVKVKSDMPGSSGDSGPSVHGLMVVGTYWGTAREWGRWDTMQDPSSTTLWSLLSHTAILVTIDEFFAHEWNKVSLSPFASPRSPLKSSYVHVLRPVRARGLTPLIIAAPVTFGLSLTTTAPSDHRCAIRCT